MLFVNSVSTLSMLDVTIIRNENWLWLQAWTSSTENQNGVLKNERTTITKHFYSATTRFFLSVRENIITNEHIHRLIIIGVHWNESSLRESSLQRSLLFVPTDTFNLILSSSQPPPTKKGHFPLCPRLQLPNGSTVSVSQTILTDKEISFQHTLLGNISNKL